MARRASSLLLAIAILALAMPPAVHAQRSEAAEKGREAAAIRAAVARGEVLPLPRILAIAQAAAPGDVIEVETEYEHGRVIYEIKTLATNGRVREVEVDARTGTVIKVEDD